VPLVCISEATNVVNRGAIMRVLPYSFRSALPYKIGSNIERLLVKISHSTCARTPSVHLPTR
jgi:hypothetical protein